MKTELFYPDDILKHHSDFIAGDALLGGQKAVWSTFGIQATKNGACGDPTTASAEKGRVIVEAYRKHGAEYMREYYYHKRIMPDEE